MNHVVFKGNVYSNLLVTCSLYLRSTRAFRFISHAEGNWFIVAAMDLTSGGCLRLLRAFRRMRY